MTPPPPARDDDDQLPQRRYSDRFPSASDQELGIQKAPLFVAIFTLIAFIFSIGVNYQKLASVSDSFTKFVSEANNTYVRRDVQSEQIQNLQTEIEMLRSEVLGLSDIVLAQESAAASRRTLTPPAPSNPRFERK